MAKRHIDLDSHRTEAMLEDADFLFSHGVSLADACRRIGVNEDALVRALQRRKDRSEHDPDPVPFEGEAPPGWPVSAMRRAG